MDNRIFNINGNDSDKLLRTLELVFDQCGYEEKCTDWVEDKEKGIILLWSSEKQSNKLITPMTARQVCPMIEAWLEGDFAKSMVLGDWEKDLNHDGYNKTGWRCYVEDWGHVGDYRHSIVAVKPCYLWYGK